MKTKTTTALTALTAMFCTSADVLAHPSTTVRDTITLPEYNVVAVKQQDRLSEQPLAATLLTAADLEQLNATALRSISDVVPNFYMPDYGSRITSSIYVRGIGARIDQPAVGLIVDNVAILNKNAYDFDLADIASVEMLRGPQSTLFGRNTMGGLINISTSSPLRRQDVRLTAETGTHLRIRARAAVNRRLSEKFGIGVSANYTDTRGEYTNHYNGAEVDHERSGGVRMKAEWRVKPRVRVINTLAASLLHQSGYPYEHISSGEIAYDDTCYYRRFTLTDGLTVSHSYDRYTLTSVTSVQHLNDNLTLDQDFLPTDYFTLTQAQHEIAVTQDIVARSHGGDSPYGWLGGVFGFYKYMNMDAPVTFKDTGIKTLIENHRNQANPMYPIRWDTRSFPLNSEFRLPTWGIALYHESTLSVGHFNLTAALRLDYEHAAMRYHSYCDTGYTIDDPDGQPYRHVNIDIDDRGRLSRHHLTLLPRFGAVYNLGRETGNIYASISKGYKSGGYNTQMFSEVLQQRLMSVMGIGGSEDIDAIVGYRPEKSWNYEVGAHLWPADDIGIEAALFYIDCRDQQLTMFPEGTTTGRMMTNAGQTRSMGAELTVHWQPATDWNLTASYGLTDARFVHFHDGRADYADKRLPYVPANTLFVQGIYNHEWTGKFIKSVTAEVNLRGTGDIYWNEANTQRQAFYLLPGAQITAEAGMVTLSVWGKNLTATHYDTFYFVSMGNEFVQRAKTREIGVTLTVKW